MDAPPRDVLTHLIGYALPRATCSVDVRRALRWSADLRLVCRRWRDHIDDGETFYWFHVAEALDLDPPRHLYAGGTYLEVCRGLASAEAQREEARREASGKTPGFVFATGCMMIAPRRRPDHPRPERPAVKLPDEMAARVAANARALEAFLGAVDFEVLRTSAEGGHWHESATIRYRMFLNLRRAHPGVWLVPTADIEFCWLAHIFRTESYWSDMRALGIDPGHSLRLGEGEVATFARAAEATAALWNETYGPAFPYLPEGTDTSWQIWKVMDPMEALRRDASDVVYRCEPRRFFPCMGPETPFLPRAGLPGIHLTAEDVRADLRWFPGLKWAFQEMKEASYDVLRGRGNDDDLIHRQVMPSYERFLNLCNKGVNGEVAPPYVLDLIWHAHQMEPVQYRKDCLGLFGREFWHQPWPHGLGVSHEVSQELKCAWKSEYGTPVVEDWQFFLPIGNEGSGHAGSKMAGKISKKTALEHLKVAMKPGLSARDNVQKMVNDDGLLAYLVFDDRSGVPTHYRDGWPLDQNEMKNTKLFLKYWDTGEWARGPKFYP